MTETRPAPEPVRCRACAALGRTRLLRDPVSIALGMGPKCFRRAVEGDPATGGRWRQADLGLDLPEPAPRRRGTAVAA